MLSAPSETFTFYHFMPIRLGGNFYRFTQMSPGATFTKFRFGRAKARPPPHTRTGMPIALAVSHTSMHHRASRSAHGVGPAGTTCMALHGTP